MALLSSLTIHPLGATEKLGHFQDRETTLVPRGVLAIAGLRQMAHLRGVRLAVDAWGEAVRWRAHKMDGRLDADRRFEDQ